MSKRLDLDRVAATEQAIFAKRARFINEVVGVLSASFAYAALGTDAPRFYALLGALFIIVFMSSYGRQYVRLFKLWREVDHPLQRFRFTWRHYTVFIFGWSFLGLVALGVLTKRGLVGLVA